MTFDQLLNAVYDDLGYLPAQPEQVTRMKRWMNEGQRHIISQPGINLVLEDALPITTVGNQPQYGLPRAIQVVRSVSQVTNQTRLRMMTKDVYRSINPGLQNTSDYATNWVPWGWGPVIRQPGGTGLWAVSDSALDTTQKFQVAGFFTNGDIAPTLESAVLNGVTRVQLGALTTWHILEQLNLTGAGVGTIRVYDAAVAGNELLRLPPGQTSAMYQQIRLFPTPSSVIEYTMDARLALLELVNANAIPVLPEDFHDLLSLYCRRREYMRAGDSRLGPANREWEERLVALRWFLEFPPDYNPTSCSALGGLGWNNLGPDYPADFYWM